MTQVDHLQALAKAAVDDNLLLFLGAGLSAGPTGLPTGAELAGELATSIDLPPGQPLPLIAEKVEALHGRAALLAFLRSRISGESTPLPAHRLVSQLPIRTVVTTNYDLLLERSYEVAGLKYRRVTRPTDVLEGSGGIPTIFKIHGSIDVDENDAPIIVTERDAYEHFLAGRSIFLDVLRAWFLTKICLFIGFGLRDTNFLHMFFQISRMLRDANEAMEGRFFAVQLRADPTDVRIWESRGIKILEASAEDFLEELVSAVEFRTVKVDEQSGLLSFQPGTPVDRVTRRDLDRMAAVSPHYHRFVLVSERKRRFLIGHADSGWAQLSFLSDGTWRSEEVVVGPAEAATAGVAVPRQVRTFVGMPHGNFVLEGQSLILRRWSPSPLDRLRIPPGSWIGRPLLVTNDEALDENDDRGEAFRTAIMETLYVQLRPLEMERLQLVAGDKVVIEHRDAEVRDVVVVPQRHDNLFLAYMPRRVLEELGVAGYSSESPIDLIPRGGR